MLYKCRPRFIPRPKIAQCDADALTPGLQRCAQTVTIGDNSKGWDDVRWGKGIRDSYGNYARESRAGGREMPRRFAQTNQCPDEPKFATLEAQVETGNRYMLLRLT